MADPNLGCLTKGFTELRYWIILLCLLYSPLAVAQSPDIFHLRAEIKSSEPGDRIYAYRLLDGENKLILVGQASMRVLDLTTARVLETYPISIPGIAEDSPRLICPNGQRMLVFGNYDSRRKEDRIKRPPAIWDLRTGKQIAVLQGLGKPVRAAIWSANGKTLVTSSDKNAPRFVDSTSVEISFWDGETFKYRNSLPSDKVSWWYLTADGAKCFFATAPVTNWLYIMRFIGTNRGPISVWDTSAGKIEQTISASRPDLPRIIRGITVSPDERFLAFVSQPAKSNKSDRILHVWEIEKSGLSYEIRPKFEITRTAKIAEDGASFSTDGRFLTFRAGKVLEICEADSGQKKFELPGGYPPAFWLNDNRILLYDYGPKMEAVEMQTGRQLYQQPLLYLESHYTQDDMDVTEVIDRTTILVQPGNNFLLTHSNQFVKIYDGLKGELLQTIVSPPLDQSKPVDPKTGPRYKSDPLVWKAGWSSDGQTFFVIDDARNSVSLWGR